jgi:integrase/recombinase XerD
MVDKFKQYLIEEGKSGNTISSYMHHLSGFLSWHNDSFGSAFEKLYRMNVLDYISFLKNIKKTKEGQRLTATTINSNISAIIKFNEFLIDNHLQDDLVISKKDNIKIQRQFASPTEITKQNVEAFRQKILESESKRDYAIVTIMAYAGLRISEVVNLKIEDVGIVSKEIIVESGKGDKQRTVFMNDKIINAIKEYMKDRSSDSGYLFCSRQSDKLNRTRINQIFNKYSDKITPHSLRHFYCTNALETGYSIHEVANQAGHSNIHTTLLYTNPSREKMKEKANKL